MRHIDFFDSFRYLLTIVAGVYAVVVTVQSLYGWYVFLSAPDKYISLIRRYVVVQGLRLRIKSFWADVVVCAGLAVILGLLALAHHLVWQADLHGGRFVSTH